MLIFARGVALLTAVIVIVNIAVGAMTDPDFLFPDIALAVILVLVAIVPRKREAALGLVAALGFAVGVFSVALSTQAGAGEVNLPLTVIVLFDLGALIVAALTLRRPAATA